MSDQIIFKTFYFLAMENRLEGKLRGSHFIKCRMTPTLAITCVEFKIDSGRAKPTKSCGQSAAMSINYDVDLLAVCVFSSAVLMLI